ncbi:hypothetical protein QQP08_004343 [Theobroma cacao]|nr:hypothetical protein QQP08_004343 [Theobroma cacao]
MNGSNNNKLKLYSYWRSSTSARVRIAPNLEALEKLSKDHAGRYATGDEVYMADLFLAPQIDFATKTFKVDMVMSLPELVTINMCIRFPVLSKLNEYYVDMLVVKESMPEYQPDAPSITS